MTTHYQQHNREFIDHAVSMVTGSDGQPARSLRDVGRELGLAQTTLHNWVYRAAREATIGKANPPHEEPNHEDPRRPDQRSTGPEPARGGRRRGPTDRLAHLSREYERLMRENAGLKAILVLLVRDLGNRT
jgi:hypothetical protein